MPPGAQQIWSAEAMARLHGGSFLKGWAAASFAELRADPKVITVETSEGFAMARTVLDEAEILTLVIAHDARGQGHGTALLTALIRTLRKAQIRRLFLEVAEDNRAARALYARHGFVTDGFRRGYYPRPNGAVDAVMMHKSLWDGC